MSNTGEGEKKLHIDSDWKSQMQAEKERLAREAEAHSTVPPDAAAGGPAGAAGAEHEEDLGELPPASMQVLIHSLATQAMMFLSPQRHPHTGESMQNLELAKHTVDLLSVLEEKTRGNLTADEKRYLDTVLYQLRMAYVEVSNRTRG
jgi:hypothetical protein